MNSKKLVHKYARIAGEANFKPTRKARIIAVPKRIREMRKSGPVTTVRI